MASIRPLSSGRFQVRWRQDGKEPSEVFKTRAQAIKFRGLVDAAGQRWPEGWIPGYGFAPKSGKGGPTLAEWFERTIKARTGANERTKDDYRRDFRNHVPEWLAQTPVGDITKEQAGLWINELREKDMAPKTMLNVHGLVSSVIADAQHDGLVQRNPFRGLLRGTSKKPVEEMVFLTPEEFRLLHEHISPHFKDFVRFLYSSGVRLGEATALAPSAVDYDGGRVHIERAWKRGARGKPAYLGDPKTDRSNRWVTLSGDMMDIIKRHASDHPEYVWVNTAGDRINGNTFFCHSWRPSVLKAMHKGLGKKPRIHDLRHTHASILLSQGVSMMAVSRRLGHSSITVTDGRYAHLLPTVDDQVRDALERSDWL